MTSKINSINGATNPNIEDIKQGCTKGFCEENNEISESRELKILKQKQFLAARLQTINLNDFDGFTLYLILAQSATSFQSGVELKLRRVENIIKRDNLELIQNIENFAIAAIKEIGEEVEAKFTDQTANTIESGRVRLNIEEENEIGETENRIIDISDDEVNRFTPEEIERVKAIIFEAVEIGYQLRALEQEIKDIIAQKRKDQQETANREKQFWASVQAEQGQTVKKAAPGKWEIEVEANKHDIIMTMLRESREAARADEERRAEELKHEKDQKAEIIREEVKKDEVKRNSLTGDVRANEVRKEEIQAATL